MEATKRPITETYKRLAEVPLELALELITKHLKTRGKAKEEIAGIMVKVTGVRLRTYALHGYTCSSCGLKATHFAIDTPYIGPETPHLNLWARTPEGEEVLMTHDHTLARSLGGRDHNSNTTPMCNPCNFAKSIGEGIERRARRIHA